MDQAGARELLGLARDASAAEILAAYRARGRRLKRRFVEARSIEARERARRALRNLVVLRDLALGPLEAQALRARRAAERKVLVDDFWRPEDGVPMALPDRAGALRWLGFFGEPALATLRSVLDARVRQIKLRIARAANEYDLRLWQQTLLDFRRIAAVALAADLPPDFEDTMTETPPSR